MKHIIYQPSFNNEVVKSLTKDQFLEQHPDHGEVWDKLHKEEAPKKETKEPGKGK